MAKDSFSDMTSSVGKLFIAYTGSVLPLSIVMAENMHIGAG